MGLNNKRGRIPNYIKEWAKREVDQYGALAYQYACYNTGFSITYPKQTEDFQLIDCIVKELKVRKIW